MLLERGGWLRLDVADEEERMRLSTGSVEVLRKAASSEGGRNEASEALRPVRLIIEGLPEKMTETARANSL